MRAEPATRRRIGIGLIAVVVTLTTAACATGQHAQTANETPAIDGANANIGSIQLHDVAIKAPTGGPSYPKGGAAEITAVIVNNGTSADTLIGVNSAAASSSALYANPVDAATVLTASPSASPIASPSVSPTTSTVSTAPSTSSTGAAASSPAASATSSSSGAATLTSLDVPAGENANLGVNPTDPVLVITGLTGALFPGTAVQITFTFQNAGSVTLSVPVQITANSGNFTPVVIPSGTPAG